MMALKIRITCGSRKMSCTQYHKQGKPNWWARVGSGPSVKFVRMPKVCGDMRLDVRGEIDLEPGVYTLVTGVGSDIRDDDTLLVWRNDDGTLDYTYAPTGEEIALGRGIDTTVPQFDPNV